MKDYEPVYWWYTAWKASTAVIIVVLGSIPTVLLGWDTMLPSGKMVAVGGLFLSAWKALDLVVDRVMGRIAAGKTPLPVPNDNGQKGDTEQISKPK